MLNQLSLFDANKLIDSAYDFPRTLSLRLSFESATRNAEKEIYKSTEERHEKILQLLPQLKSLKQLLKLPSHDNLLESEKIYHYQAGWIFALGSVGGRTETYQRKHPALYKKYLDPVISMINACNVFIENFGTGKASVNILPRNSIVQTIGSTVRQSTIFASARALKWPHLMKESIQQYEWYAVPDLFSFLLG
jgi:hypothetical protein